MAPKAKVKKPKKTKEELEEERRLAEEERRIAEEERLKCEEEERQRLAELERQRLELLALLNAQQRERLHAQNVDLAPLFSQLHLERAAANAQQLKAWEWDRFLSCSYAPHPRDRVAMSDELRAMAEVHDLQMQDALQACQDCYTMIQEAQLFMLQAVIADNKAQQLQHSQDVVALHELVVMRSDRATAHTLQHADEFANDKGEIQLGCCKGSFQWALWVNTSKNPRLKAVEMAALHMIVEVPKQIALANIAMRVQLRERDEFFTRSANEFMAVGAVLYADLLALPPPAKHIKQWVLRQITPLATNVVRLPYPIPPAGADPATYRSEEEPPPLGFAYPFSNDTLLLDGEQVKVGWWDPELPGWRTTGVSEVQLDTGSCSLSFRTTHMGVLAMIQSRARLLPYTSWSVRPTGGRGGSTAAITLEAPSFQEPIVIEVGPGWASLVPPTCLPGLLAMAGVRLPPEQLLLQLSARGLHLLPEDRDAPFAGVIVKDHDTELAMCRDLALLGGVFLMARSRWNQAGSKPDECIVRLSEVTDWEAGGRTEPHHVIRIFNKEKEEGERRVMAVMRRGTEGVAFVDAWDKRDLYPCLPGHDSAEHVQACLSTIWGEVQASLLCLLRGPPKPAPAPPIAPPAQFQTENSEGDLASAEPSAISVLSIVPELLASEPEPAQFVEEVLVPSGPTAKELLAVASLPVAAAAEAASAAHAVMEPVLQARLNATTEGLELVRNTNPVFTETLANTLHLLRVLSFS